MYIQFHLVGMDKGRAFNAIDNDQDDGRRKRIKTLEAIFSKKRYPGAPFHHPNFSDVCQDVDGPRESI